MNNQTQTQCHGVIFALIMLLALLFTNAARADYKATILADHPVGYWPLDLSVDTNGTATDLSGNTNIGNYVSITTANEVPGPSSYITNAVSFAGASTFVDLSPGPNTAALNFGGTITMEAWVQPAVNNGGLGDVLAKGYDSSTFQELEMRVGGSSTFHGGTYNSDGSFQDRGATSGTGTTNWAYEVVTWDGTNWNLYVNGSLAATGADNVGAPNFSDPWAIGDGTSGGNGRFFTGNICQAALYTNALTPAQVFTHYAIGAFGTTNLLPQITSQPASADIFSNAPVTISVVAGSAAPLSYRWFLGTSPLAGQTNASLAIAHFGAANAGNYAVVIANISGAVTSSVATLTLKYLPTTSLPYRTTVLGDNPIGYWPLDLSVDTNGTATDLSGNTNFGNYITITAANEVSGPSSFITNAITFDGASTFVDLSPGPNTAALNFGGTITMEAWVQPTAAQLTGGFGDVLGKGYDALQGYDELEMRVNGTTFHGGTYGAAGDKGVSASMATTNWAYEVVSWDGKNWNLYVNGSSAGTGADSVGALNFSDFWAIGAGTADGAGRRFNGNICQVALYTNALTPAQVYLHYLAGQYGSLTNLPPIISGQPANTTVLVSGAGTFTVTAIGMAPYYYQWYLVSGGATNAIAGATHAMYITPPASAGMNGNGYFVVVTDSAGREGTSSNATLTVALAPPQILSTTLSNGNLIFSGVNGVSGGTYYVLASTNVALPLSQWTPIATNTFNGSGGFTVTNGLTGGVLQQFYRLQVP